jgi:rubrerythrin
MEIKTASAAISFTRKLEEDSAKFYEELSRRFVKHADVLLSFARENRKNIVQVERAYYGVISDAIEGCFAFNINPGDYVLKTEIAEEVDYSDALMIAMAMEETIVKFYSDAAEQSKSLMADVPRTFKMVAKRRNDRRQKLESLLNRESQ